LFSAITFREAALRGSSTFCRGAVSLISAWRSELLSVLEAFPITSLLHNLRFSVGSMKLGLQLRISNIAAEHGKRNQASGE
jgi:hypothetical protein